MILRMKKKVDLKILIITTIICLLPIILGVILYDKLPEQMAVHFGPNNQPNSYASKAFAVFGISSILALLQVVCCVFSDLMENKKQNKKFITIYKWIVPVISLMVNLSILAYSIGIGVDIHFIVCITIGIVFTILGNYFPKSEPNKLSFRNINEIIWKEFKRPIAYFLVIMGLLFIISAFLNSIFSLILLGIVLLATIIMLIVGIRLVYKNKK